MANRGDKGVLIILIDTGLPLCYYTFFFKEG